MKTATRVSAAVILVFWTLTAVAATNGSLKVTSFPSGAQVRVDGVDTGKVTPMSISLTEGDHTITVQLPGSGWNPDTRTVTIVAGNNDLSVTLLPTISAGPAGPPGAPGAPAMVRAAGSGECPTGGIVVTSGDGTTSLPVCNGAQGVQGVQGVQGIQGLQGEPGPPGQPAEAPGIDPVTLVNFGSNLRVNLGDGSGDLPLGISPVYVEIPASMNEVSRLNITYTPSPKLRVAPFAIAANTHLRDEESQPADHSPKLTEWFDDWQRGNPSARRTIRVTLRDLQADNLMFEMTECVPTTLDSNFAGIVRVVVKCSTVSSVTVVGQPGSSGELLFLPARAVVPPLVLNLNHSRQLIANVSGGSNQLVTVDSIPRIAINALHMRAGTVNNDDGFSSTEIASWIAASLARDPNGQFKTIEIAGPDGTTIARYSNMFLTSIGLINPGHMSGSVDYPPNSVFSRIEFYPSIRIGFDLSMLPGQP